MQEKPKMTTDKCYKLQKDMDEFMYIFSHDSLLAIDQAKACSLPPDPNINTFISGLLSIQVQFPHFHK